MKILVALICLNVALCQFPILKAQTSDIVVKPKSTKSILHIKKARVTKPAVIQFISKKIDFGTIKEDAVIEKSFEFTNAGTTDLIIIDATGSCGCTLPTIPTAPIPPGGKNKITVRYTAKNKVGPQKPLITVVTNGTPGVIKLQLEGWVDQIPGGVK